jgi:hypothetical protein
MNVIAFGRRSGGAPALQTPGQIASHEVVPLNIEHAPKRNDESVRLTDAFGKIVPDGFPSPSCRADGGLRAWSDDVPGLVLSHADPAAVLARPRALPDRFTVEDGCHPRL